MIIVIDTDTRKMCNILNNLYNSAIFAIQNYNNYGK